MADRAVGGNLGGRELPLRDGVVPVLLAVFIERTRATFNIMLRDHVPLVFESDTPAADGFGNPPGLNGRLEMQNWADSGAPLSLLLRAATIDNARVGFGGGSRLKLR